MDRGPCSVPFIHVGVKTPSKQKVTISLEVIKDQELRSSVGVEIV